MCLSSSVQATAEEREKEQQKKGRKYSRRTTESTTEERQKEQQKNERKNSRRTRERTAEEREKEQQKKGRTGGQRKKARIFLERRYSLNRKSKQCSNNTRPKTIQIYLRITSSLSPYIKYNSNFSVYWDQKSGIQNTICSVFNVRSSTNDRYPFTEDNDHHTEGAPYLCVVL